MANIKSAIKRIKIANANTIRNKSVKSGVKSAIKNFEDSISKGDLEGATALFPKLTSTLDRAVTKGVLHKSAANRKKSRLALKLKGIQN